MILKPQDILVALKLLLLAGQPWAFNTLAVSLGMSASEVHAAVTRLRRAGLLSDQAPIRPALKEFLIHGLRYVFVPERGGLVRGIPTAHAAPPLLGLMTPDGDPPPVWPDPEGAVRGLSLEPLYKSVPIAIRADPALYEWLAALDALRIGRARERKLAIDWIETQLHGRSHDVP